MSGAVHNANHYMVNISDIEPKEVRADQGWISMDIRFPLPIEVARAGGVALFRAVFKPGAEHRAHQHPNADEFFYVIRGRAAIGSGDEVHEVGAGTVELVPRGTTHWLRNLDSDEVEVLGGYLGVGSLEEAGYIQADTDAPGPARRSAGRTDALPRPQSRALDHERP